MKTYYRDSYGCTASIMTKKNNPDFAELVVRNQYGKLIQKKQYRSLKGAKIALGKLSDGWLIVGGPYSWFI